MLEIILDPKEHGYDDQFQYNYSGVKPERKILREKLNRHYHIKKLEKTFQKYVDGTQNAIVTPAVKPSATPAVKPSATPAVKPSVEPSEGPSQEEFIKTLEVQFNKLEPNVMRRALEI